MDNERCNECGAPHLHGMNCWEMLGGLLAWEAHDPALLAEHFLSVASYNIQHPAQFVDTAIIQLQNGFIGYLDGSMGHDHRRCLRARSTGGRRRSRAYLGRHYPSRTQSGDAPLRLAESLVTSPHFTNRTAFCASQKAVAIN
jgi:hypothetical protein